ncbi:hypothetical protein [Roseovarius sp. THAF9]|uniref:hypothetical protein n=1 Tax=Roseovarius sp. THAF9 TaxID=2587847 RepID=UPI001562647B|nr:hypothetical protein [Roseovarius sp. THAF9]
MPWAFLEVLDQPSQAGRAKAIECFIALFIRAGNPLVFERASGHLDRPSRLLSGPMDLVTVITDIASNGLSLILLGDAFCISGHPGIARALVRVPDHAAFCAPVRAPRVHRVHIRQIRMSDVPMKSGS